MLQVFIFSLIVFGGITCAYQYIGNKKNKSDSDIRTRRVLIEVFSYSFIIAICAVLITAHWQGYIRIWGAKGNVDDFTTLVELIAILLYILVKPIRKAMETVYTKSDIKNIVTCCLYLRSFNTDKLRGEKNICKIFNKYCPTLSIGNPNVILPFTHSKRIYVTDDNWKSAVEELMAKARIVLLRVGDTDGTKWEISRALINNHLRKTIFLVYSYGDYNILQSILMSFHYSLPALDCHISDKMALAYYISSNGYCWNVQSIQSKKEIKQLLREFKSQHLEIANEKRITLTGKQRSFWTWFWGNGELPYYRIRVFLYLFFAAVISSIFGAYGIRVFNSKQYALSESSWGWVGVKHANIIESGMLLEREKMISYSISPDYKSLTVKWENGVTSFFDLSTDSLSFTFLDWEEPTGIGYSCDGTQCLAIIKNNLIIAKDSIIKDTDGSQYHVFIKDRIVPRINHLCEQSDSSKNIDYYMEENSESVDDEFLYSFECSNLLMIGSYLLSYNYYDGLSIVDIEKPNVFQSIGGGHLDEIGYCRTENFNNILLSPDGNDIFLYNISNRIKEPVICSSCSTPKRIYTDANAKIYAIVGNDRISGGKRQFVIDLFDSDYKKLFSCIGHSWTVTSIAFSPDGTRMVSISNDNTVRVWNTYNGDEICRIIIEDSYSDNDFAVFAGNGSQVLIYVNGSLYLYDIVGDKLKNKEESRFKKPSGIIDMKESYRNEVKNIFEIEDAKCPEKLNETFTIDQINYNEGVVTFHITIDESYGRLLKENIPKQKKAIMESIQSQPNYEEIKEMYIVGDISLVYLYKHSDSKREVTVKITPQDWK